MTLFQIINTLQAIAQTQPNIRSCGEGDIYEFYNANPSIEYSTFFITQGQHSSDESFDNYNLTLFFVDRLLDDESNKLQIQSTGKSLLQNVIGVFCEDYDAESETIQYQPFTQRFTDMCAGVYATVTFLVAKDGLCTEDGGYYPKPPIFIKNQTKDLKVTENGVYTVSPDEGFSGLDRVNVEVQVAGGTGVDAYSKVESDARYAKKNDVYTKQEIIDKGYLTEVPKEYVTETELEQKGYATPVDLEGKQETLVSGTNIKTINGVSILGEGNLTIEGGGGTPVDSYTKEQADAKFATKVDTYSKTDIDQKGFITEIPQEYVTETELSQKGYTTMGEVEKKGYITDIPIEYVTETELERKGFLTEIPAEYITDTELTQKGFITAKEIETKGYLTEVPATYQTTEQADAKYLQEIPSEYVTDTELTTKGYTTMSEVEKKGYITEVPATYQTIEQADAKYLQSVPDEYVTDTELTQKGYATTAYVDEKLSIITTKLSTI